MFVISGDLERPSVFGRRPLHIAARKGCVNVVRLLVENKTRCNVQDKEFGNSPLHYAAQNGHTEVVKALCEDSVDPNIKNAAGLTVEQLASQENR